MFVDAEQIKSSGKPTTTMIELFLLFHSNVDFSDREQAWNVGD